MNARHLIAICMTATFLGLCSSASHDAPQQRFVTTEWKRDTAFDAVLEPDDSIDSILSDNVHPDDLWVRPTTTGGYLYHRVNGVWEKVDIGPTVP